MNQTQTATNNPAVTAPTHPHTYGAGTRLSSAYTMGRKGLPCPKHSSEPSSAAYRAWKAGNREWLQHEKGAA